MSNSMPTTSMAALRLRWDVFLSFRGADTRGTITSSLYKSLDNQGVRVFLDDVGLDKGDAIDTGLFEAIEDSAASILLISPKYASSHWCLKEMARLCELGRLILPVFYEVDPSHVRRQKGPFEKDFDKHLSRYGEEIVEKWRKAMEKVGGKSGWVCNNGSRYYCLLYTFSAWFVIQFKHVVLKLLRYLTFMALFVR